MVGGREDNSPKISVKVLADVGMNFPDPATALVILGILATVCVNFPWLFALKSGMCVGLLLVKTLRLLASWGIRVLRTTIAHQVTWKWPIRTKLDPSQ